MLHALGIDIGGSHIAAGIINPNGELIARQSRDIDRSHSGASIIYQDLIPAIAGLLEAHPGLAIAGIGLGLPGNINQEEGICLFSPNLQWHNLNLRKPISAAFNLPLYLLNDVRCAALGEQYFGAGRDCLNFICIALGTGIGGGIVVNGKLILGACQGAGEIGHMTILPEGPRCNCGNYGCWEALASGLGITRRYREALSARQISPPEHFNPKTIYQAACEHEPLALATWEDTGKYLGIGIANLITIMNPQKIIIGGKIADAWEFFYPALQAEIKARVKMVPWDCTPVVKAGLGANANLVGAAVQVFLHQDIPLA